MKRNLKTKPKMIGKIEQISNHARENIRWSRWIPKTMMKTLRWKKRFVVFLFFVWSFFAVFFLIYFIYIPLSKNGDPCFNFLFLHKFFKISKDIHICFAGLIFYQHFLLDSKAWIYHHFIAPTCAFSNSAIETHEKCLNFFQS